MVMLKRSKAKKDPAATATKNPPPHNLAAVAPKTGEAATPSNAETKRAAKILYGA